MEKEREEKVIMRKALIVLAVFIIVGCGVSVEQRDNSNDRVTRKKPSIPTTQYSLLIRQLGAEDWQTRAKAQKELIKTGHKLIMNHKKVLFGSEEQKAQSKNKIKIFANTLLKISKNNDTEVKMRAKFIRRYFYNFLEPKIAFVALNNSNLELHTMDWDGRNIIRLTQDGCNKYYPCWNPDGTKIAFQSRETVRNNYIMCLIDADGNNLVKLTDGKINCEAPDWNPEGTKIVFMATMNNFEQIFVMDADGKNITSLITSKNSNNICPRWSPDGKKIVFASDRDGRRKVYLMDIATKGIKQLTNHGNDDIACSWSPDGTKILYISGYCTDRTHIRIYVMDADGSNQQQLTNDKEDCNYSARWSPDGERIFFASNRDEDWNIYVMDKDGKNHKRLTKDNNHNKAPNVKPCYLPEISEMFALEKK